MFSVGTSVWVLMIVELAERIAYYGAAFTLTTFSIDMLHMNLQTTNVISNLLYVVSPVAAVVSGALSDTYLQRKKVLAVGGTLYALGLCLVATSGSPFMFPDFPNGTPYGNWGPILVVLGTMVFGCGYGTMKVCIAPLLADTALVGWGKDGHCCNANGEGATRVPDGNRTDHQAVASGAEADEPQQEAAARESEGGCRCGCAEGGYPCRCNVQTRHLRESITGLGIASLAMAAVSSPHADHHHHHHNLRASTKLLDNSDGFGTYGGGNSTAHTSNITAKSLEEFPADAFPGEPTAADYSDGADSESGDESEADEEATKAEEVGALLSKLFRVDYWVINFGSMIGIGGTPFIRALDGRTQTPKPGDTDQDIVHVGYYIGYWACAAITAFAVVLFLARMHTFASNRPGEAPGLFRSIFLSLRNGFPRLGRLQAHACPSSKSPAEATLQTSQQPQTSSSGDSAASNSGDIADATSMRRSVRLRITQHSHRCIASEDDRLLAATKSTVPMKIRAKGEDLLPSSATTLFLRAFPVTIAECYCAHFFPTSAAQPRLQCDACIHIVHAAFEQYLQEESQETSRVLMLDLASGEEHVSVEPGMLFDWRGPSFLQYALLDWFVSKHLVAAPGRRPHQNNLPSQQVGASDDAGMICTRDAAQQLSGAPQLGGWSLAHLVPPGSARAIATTMSVCSIFLALPVYWLLAIQFSTNVVMQAGWMEMPAASILPPEIFNNVNTLTILVSIPVFEYFFKRVYGPNRRPPVAGRMIAGFLLMLLAMVMVAFLQAVIVNRGTFVSSSSGGGGGGNSTNTTTTTEAPSDSGDGSDVSYQLNPGAEYISATWLVIPYFIQGLAAVLVDTTCIEAAYTSAPANMKGSVMALYLLASSVSGFLGLIYAPFITPQTMLEVMISFAVLQAVVTTVFALLYTSASMRLLTSLFCWGGARVAVARHHYASGDAIAVDGSADRGEAALLTPGGAQTKKKNALERVVLAEGHEEE